MWGINPKLLCRQHLLGEHNEIHKHRHNFVKHHSIAKRIAPVVQIEPENMMARHDALVEEMLARGYNHNSPYEQPDLSHLSHDERYAEIDIYLSIADLINRCPECSKRISDVIAETGKETLKEMICILESEGIYTMTTPT
jgi:hypothetical protein